MSNLTQQQIQNLVLALTQTEKKITLKNAFENFIEYSTANVREETIHYYNKQWKYCMRFFQEERVITYLNDITPTVLTQMELFYKKLNYSNSSINKFIEMIKMVYSFCHSHGFIDSNPIRDFKKLKKDTPETQIIPRNIKEQIFIYLDTLKNDDVYNLRNKLIVYLLNETGIRRNELLHILTKNVIIEENTIHLSFTKTHEHRDVYFTDETKELIIMYLSKVPEREYFFQNLVSHEPMDKSSIANFLDHIKITLDIEISISPHKWRHSLATELMDSNLSIKEIQELLGHTNLTTTQKYLHTNKKKTKKDILDVLKKKKIRD